MQTLVSRPLSHVACAKGVHHVSTYGARHAGLRELPPETMFRIARLEAQNTQV